MRRDPRPLVLAFGLLLAAAPPSLAVEPRPGLTPEDLVMMRRLSDPKPSPDGRWIVYTLRETDLEANKGRTDLWLVAADGSGEPRRLTSDPAPDGSPAWSPDGAWIYFLSTRGGSSQVWRLPMAGGEAQKATDLPLDVATFLLSPSGDRLAVSMEVYVDCADLGCTVDRLAERAKSPASGRLYERLFIRHWDTWSDGRRSHLFVVPASGAGGEGAVDVARGLDADVPSKPFGGVEELAWTPDGEGLVFSARDAGASEAWSTNFDLWYAPADGSAPPRRLTDNPAWDTQPAFSPDGRSLAYLAMRRPGFEADRFRLVVRSWRDGVAGPERVVSEGWDRSPGGFFFAPSGASVYATAEDRGQTRLFSLDLASGEATEIWGDGTVRSPALAGDRLVFGLERLTHPADLFSLPRGGGEATQLTRVNADRLATIEMGRPEQFSFAGWNGETVYGYLVKPVGFDPAKRYPVAFLIHGGPQGSFGNDFHYRWNPQTYAGQGYAVVTVDFHGSTGYGQAFTDAIRQHWGDRPLEDLQKGWRHATSTWSFLDGDRACALGASYGGYMINWIAGQWPDAFRCLVNHDGLLDLRGDYYSTEELWFPEWEMGGTPWQAPEEYERFNPARFIDRWRTPMLVVHGALDFRVVETEGLSTFTALQRRGIPSKLLYFPDENHWVLAPENSLLWQRTVLDWLARWTSP